MRIMACSSSKRNSASARASSVLPTPVGPRKMKLPIGRLGSFRPERARITASATAVTASSWPMTRWCSSSSRCSSFCISPSSSLVTGMPVQRLTTSAMSSSSTSSLISRAPLPLRPRSVSSCSCRSSCGELAVLQLGGAVQVVLPLGLLDLDLGLLDLLAQLREPLHGVLLRLPPRLRARRPRPCRSASSFSSLLEPLARGGVLLLAERLALDLELHDAAAEPRPARRASSRSRCAAAAAASSTRSIALSGRKRSVM